MREEPTLGPAAPEQEWWVGINGEARGPYTLRSLQEYMQAGRINADTLFCRDGRDAWLRLDEDPSLILLLQGPAAAKQPPLPAGSRTQSGERIFYQDRGYCVSDSVLKTPSAQFPIRNISSVAITSKANRGLIAFAGVLLLAGMIADKGSSGFVIAAVIAGVCGAIFKDWTLSVGAGGSSATIIQQNMQLRQTQRLTQIQTAINSAILHIQGR